MADKKPTHVVTFPSLYLRVNGKLQEMKEGTGLALDTETAKKLEARGMVKSVKDLEAVNAKDGDKTPPPPPGK